MFNDTWKPLESQIFTQKLQSVKITDFTTPFVPSIIEMREKYFIQNIIKVGLRRSTNSNNTLVYKLKNNDLWCKFCMKWLHDGHKHG